MPCVAGFPLRLDGNVQDMGQLVESEVNRSCLSQAKWDIGPIADASQAIGITDYGIEFTAQLPSRATFAS